jgi:hypothetical protein
VSPKRFLILLLFSILPPADWLLLLHLFFLVKLGKIYPSGVPSSGNYWEPFVGIFYFCSKEKKNAREVVDFLKREKVGGFPPKSRYVTNNKKP